MVRRYELTDGEWTTLEPLLPPEKPPIGKPNRPHRVVLDGIFWRIRTGAPWPGALWALPARYGKWQTVYSRFRRWQRAGADERVDVSRRIGQLRFQRIGVGGERRKLGVYIAELNIRCLKLALKLALGRFQSVHQRLDQRQLGYRTQRTLSGFLCPYG